MDGTGLFWGTLSQRMKMAARSSAMATKPGIGTADKAA